MKNTKRKNYKNNNRKNRTYNPLRTQFDSNGPLGKVRGNAQQIAEKYAVAAREARVSGDRVLSEQLQQYCEHYSRMIVQWRLDNPYLEKDESQDNEQLKSSENQTENSKSADEVVETQTTEIKTSNKKQAV